MVASKVCIIGAGSSGIAAAKTLQEHGIEFDCFEQGSTIGGNWRYLNDNGVSAAYASLHINTSKRKMAFSDFPMPDDIPDYPHHTHVAKYFDDYVDHFDLRDRITFHASVTDVSPNGHGSWRVTLDNGRQRDYRAVLICNGHHWDRNLPEFPGSFSGEEMHSHDYKVPAGLAGKRVLIVGIGNSAVDIACEVSHHAARTLLSTRRGAHILPKYVFGKPIDHYTTPFSSRLPLLLQRLVFELLLKLARGPQSGYGIPLPQHGLLQAHPTVSSDLLMRVGHGDISIKPNIESLAGENVRFVDGSSATIDTIIYCTGYKVSFPFFKQHLISVKDNELALYRHVVHPHHAGLYFVGLIQPLGATMPLAEQQAIWIARLLTDSCELPSSEVMLQEIERERRQIRRRYVTSVRHTMQVDFYRYMRQIKKEINRKPRRSG